MPIRRLPRRVRRFYVGHRSAVGFTFLFACCLASIAIAKSDSDSQSDAINGNRVEQTRQSCRERNEERAILRRKFGRPLIVNFKVQRAQTQRVPAAAFRQFGVGKGEALERLDEAVHGLKQARADLHPLDCKARVRAVRAALD